jgi:four helix bundle protein
MATYRELDAWRHGVDLVVHCYRVTASFPASERYGLVSQMRRAALSIPVNVAEGHCRGTTRAFLNHVSIALGSQGELETCIEVGARLGFLSEPDRNALAAACSRVGRILSGLRDGLVARLDRSANP